MGKDSLAGSWLTKGLDDPGTWHHSPLHLEGSSEGSPYNLQLAKEKREAW